MRNNSNSIAMSRHSTNSSAGNPEQMEEVAGAQDTIYLCNFRVSVDGEWLCLKELQDLEIKEGGNNHSEQSHGTVANFGISSDKCEQRNDRDWATYCRCLFMLSFYDKKKELIECFSLYNTYTYIVFF